MHACSVTIVMSNSLRPFDTLWYPAKLFYPWDSPGKNPGVGWSRPPSGDLPDPEIKPALAGGFFTASTIGEAPGGLMCETESSEVAQSCLTLCDPVDCSPPGSSVHGILQARILEWVAVSFSRGSSWPRGWTQVSCSAGRHVNLWATRGDVYLLLIAYQVPDISLWLSENYFIWYIIVWGIIKEVLVSYFTDSLTEA